MEKRFRLISSILIIAIALIAQLTKTTPTEKPNTQQSTQTASLDTATQSPNKQFFEVAEVVDGDTIKVRIDNQIKTVRLLGINTPETVDPRKPVECFGKEASEYTKSLLTNRQVQLKGDETQDDTDKYGRLLRYVFLADETFINKTLIAQGYAHEYTYQIPYQYQKEFKELEKVVRENQIGLWSPETCNGKK